MGTLSTCADSHGGWRFCPRILRQKGGMCLHSSQALPGCGGRCCHQEAPVNKACLISLAGRWCQPAGSRQESSSHASDSPSHLGVVSDPTIQGARTGLPKGREQGSGFSSRSAAPGMLSEALATSEGLSKFPGCQGVGQFQCQRCLIPTGKCPGGLHETSTSSPAQPLRFTVKHIQSSASVGPLG